MMDKVFEITRIYTTHIKSKNEQTALIFENSLFKGCEGFTDVEVTATAIATKLSPETIAKIIKEAE